MFAKVFAKVFAVAEQFTERLSPPLPPETLGFRPVGGAAAEPDYPPSTCYVRVVRLGSSLVDQESPAIRGQGRAKVVCPGSDWDSGGDSFGGGR